MIKNILFDLGGVIMDLRRQDCIDAFTNLGLEDAGKYFSDYLQEGPFRGIEEGTISKDEFHKIVRNLIGKDVSDKQIDDAFMAFLVGIPEHRLDTLKELRKSYNIYMLSNTNPIMWDGKIKDEFQKQGLRLEDYFDGVVKSFEAKSLKPDDKIFNVVVEKFSIKPEETIFFDDSEANVNAAKKLGFDARVVVPGSEFIDLI